MKYIRWGSIAALLAVVLGAFAAHGLQSRVAEASIHTFEIGVRYQFYHAFALLILGLLSAQAPAKHLDRAAYFFLLGILLFSGSLYVLALKSLIGFSVSWIGPLTPIGGVFFIIGWGFLLLYSFRKQV